jgi:hypothetical protein
MFWWCLAGGVSGSAVVFGFIVLRPPAALRAVICELANDISWRWPETRNLRRYGWGAALKSSAEPYYFDAAGGRAARISESTWFQTTGSHSICV